MQLEVTRIDIINMIMGIWPSYNLIYKYETLELGSYNGAYCTWSWMSNLSNIWDKYTDDELIEFYKELKQS